MLEAGRSGGSESGHVRRLQYLTDDDPDAPTAARPGQTGLHGRLRAKAVRIAQTRPAQSRFARVSLPFQPRQAVHGRVKKKKASRPAEQHV